MKSEERIELGNDIRNAFEHLWERYGNGTDWHSRMLDRYKSGDLTFHVHIFATEGPAPWFGCLECEYLPESVSRRDRGILSQQVHLKFPGCCEADDQNRQLMLVGIYETIESAENVVPTVIRLNALDHGGCCRRKGILYKLRPGMFIEGGQILRERKVEIATPTLG